MDEKILEALKASGVSEEVISQLSKDDGTATRLTTLEAKLAAAEGKSAGILGDKKKSQEKAEALQARIDELESKDLGEVEKLKLDMTRLQSQLDAANGKYSELETTYNGEKQTHSLNKIGSGFDWMPSVPEDMRSIILAKEFEGIDLGNDVLVADRVKSMSEKYAGQLAAKVPNGTSSRPGNATQGQQGTATGMDRILATSDADILNDPAGYLKAAAEANNQ